MRVVQPLQSTQPCFLRLGVADLAKRMPEPVVTRGRPPVPADGAPEPAAIERSLGPIPFSGKKKVDLVPAARMAVILGCKVERVSQLSLHGQLPIVWVGKQKMYPVELVLRHVMSTCFKSNFAPLRRSHRDRTTYLEDAMWAWDALSSGPWNLETARTSRAWCLYLAAKSNVTTQMLLNRLHIACARREMEGGNRMIALDGAMDAAEASVTESGSPAVTESASAVAVVEDSDPFGPGSIFGDIDPSKVAGPFLEPEEPAVADETEY